VVIVCTSLGYDARESFNQSIKQSIKQSCNQSISQSAPVMSDCVIAATSGKEKLKKTRNSFSFVFQSCLFFFWFVILSTFFLVMFDITSFTLNDSVPMRSVINIWSSLVLCICVLVKQFTQPVLCRNHTSGGMTNKANFVVLEQVLYHIALAFVGNYDIIGSVFADDKNTYLKS